MTNSNIGRSELDKVVVTEKIKEIYANRLNISTTDEEFKAQLDNFLKSNKINVAQLKSLMSSKGIHIGTFYNFVKANIRWQKVLDNRFGYKISNLAMQDVVPLTLTPEKIEKEYEFSEIFISYEQWGGKNAKLIASRLEIELKAGADFEKAVERFSSAKSKVNKGKVGPIKISKLPEPFKNILGGLKKNEISPPVEVNNGLILLKLNRTRSYKTIAIPKSSVTYSISGTPSNDKTACSVEKEIKGPVLLSKIEKNLRRIITKLMPGESYKFSDKNGIVRVVTLCESFLNARQSGSLSFEEIKKNQEAQRLSNALMLELRRNTTVVKK